MILEKCSKYRKAKLLAGDGRATKKQREFIAVHESTCPSCLEEHDLTMNALNFLKHNVIEPNDCADMELRILRRWKVERRSRAVSYWMPAVAGAVVAGAALLAVLQILIASPQIKQKETKGREALLRKNAGQVVTDTPSARLDSETK